MPSDPESSAAEPPDWPGDLTSPPHRSGAHVLVLGLILSLLASMILLALATEPDSRGFGTHEQLGLSPCRMMEFTGVPCPGCGVTTSVTLAAQGRPIDSFLVQPLGLLCALALPLLAIWAVRVHRRGDDLYEVIASRKRPWVRVSLALVALAWIYKIAIS